MGRRLMGRSLAMVSIWATAFAVTAPAHAAFPGNNGKIAGADGCNLWTINPDGTHQRQVTFEPCPPFDVDDVPNQPDWSPDGTKIAYQAYDDVFVIDADGSGQVNITNTASPVWERNPSWSPDGTRIAYVRGGHAPTGPPWTEIRIMDAGGTNDAPLDADICSAQLPRWHPDGSRIVFYGATFSGSGGCGPTGSWIVNPDGTGLAPLPIAEAIHDVSPDGSKAAFMGFGDGARRSSIFVQGLDGSNRTQLTSNGAGDAVPRWSPDGTKIVFQSFLRNGVRKRPYVMNADGSDVTELTDLGALGLSWQPIPVNGYPRPLSATPMHVSLVPAYLECAAPNREHGPPLAHPSCAPPALESSNLTIRGDLTDGSRSVGFARVAVVAGAAGGADDSDVRLRVELTNVMHRADLSEYTGALRAKLHLRVTDKLNTPHPGGPGAATVQDAEFAFDAPCAGTPAPEDKSTCSVATSADSLVPGSVPEGARSVWAFDRVQVFDGGADGDVNTEGDNELFVAQGIFVP